MATKKPPKPRKTKKRIDHGFTERIYFLNVCMNPPKTTHQARQHSSSGGKFHTYKSKELQLAEETWTHYLALGKCKFNKDPRPLQLKILIVWPFNKSAPQHDKDAGQIPRPVKPDWDNVSKTVVDRLAALGVFEDDQQITDAHVYKRYGITPKLCIQIDALVTEISETEGA